MSSWETIDGRLPRVATLKWGDGLSLALTNVEEFDADYQAWIKELDGWLGGVDVHADNTQRTLSHGLFPEPSVRTGRVITLEGYLFFDTERSRTIAERFVSGILGDGGFGTLTYEVEGGPALTSTVKLDGTIKVTYHQLDTLEFQIPLIAADPFLYGESQRFQVFPAGYGIGLRYPLFSPARTGGNQVTYVEGLTSGDPTPEGGPSARFTGGTGTSSYMVNMTPVQAGNTYTLTGLAKADRTRSAFTIRYVLTGPGRTDQSGYLLASPVTREVSLDWESYSLPISVPEGYTAMTITVYTNHKNGAVTDAVQDIAVTLTGPKPGVLTFGTSNPNTRAIIENQGNSTAYPLIRIVGDMPSGFVLHDSTGRTIEYPAPVWQQAPVEVNNQDGAIYQNNLDQSARATRRQWFSIPAGSTNTVRITALQSGDGYADIIHHDTYL
ncbi:hypothetical protein [Kocuria sp. TGY1127_2]|uniref:hypothetical protein n=1 Tax=Kocuria sp. TGY1127_2 TaxID=2711328 RepID=UPI0015BFFE06|nr:hypothetical protein [Kocuria sp. TGY1127_2]